MRRANIGSLLLVSLGCFPPVGALAAEERSVDRRPEPRSDVVHRGFVYIEPEVGVQTMHLDTFDANDSSLTVGVLPTSGTGPVGGLAAGFRLSFLTLGARARLAEFPNDSTSANAGDWTAFSLDGDLGIRIPLGRVEPHVGLSAGYTGIGNLGNAVGGVAQGIDVRGANARAGAGVDVFVLPRLTVGASVTGELIALTRPGVSLYDLAQAKRVDTVDQAKARLLEADGSSIGSSVTVTAGAGLHF